MINEMVVDGGGHFSPAGIDDVHTLTILLSSYTVHDRAKGNPVIHLYTQRTQRTREQENPNVEALE